MSQQIPLPEQSLLHRVRARLGPRLTALLLAIVLEVLMLLALLTLEPSFSGPAQPEETISSFDVRPSAEQTQEEPEQDTTEPEQSQTEPEPAPVQPEQAPPTPPQPVEPQILEQQTQPTPAISIPSDQMIAPDIAPPPAQAAPKPKKKIGVKMGPKMGPSGAAGPSDTAVVGTAPNGEPLYAASWYREPTDGELRGYLSTAQGPGWGLIACRTVPDYRVEDCVPLGESPRGSNIARAVLAASWQFRVRPPRVGGELQVGEWVRIRIDYGQKSG
ncbi:hypothetical protein D6851_15585 [Altericroceibacterium spongiae]|uniref:Energy transducer TonB n=1 Tax=Altericroceibacterium spongiae TaxID=2320269 RepID=A0A420EC02_9SPHN|nr:hypothetical protein [Altericroceibacterium spongiae]RKF18227.1 hypothetical protein D6851_15585 [Altericroceibacterium spongiae]